MFDATINATFEGGTEDADRGVMRIAFAATEDGTDFFDVVVQYHDIPRVTAEMVLAIYTDNQTDEFPAALTFKGLERRGLEKLEEKIIGKVMELPKLSQKMSKKSSEDKIKAAIKDRVSRRARRGAK